NPPLLLAAPDLAAPLLGAPAVHESDPPLVHGPLDAGGAGAPSGLYARREHGCAGGGEGRRDGTPLGHPLGPPAVEQADLTVPVVVEGPPEPGRQSAAVVVRDHLGLIADAEPLHQ